MMNNPAVHYGVILTETATWDCPNMYRCYHQPAFENKAIIWYFPQNMGRIISQS